ncbi:MAG TPA: DUF502 domain-containing protein [Tepidisphaeraceae bacterium]|nr:DUF502 domain-containing protein [Tepidisphaeraceae bacterium]
MSRINTHLRDTFLAGSFALIPVVVTVVLAIYLEQQTRVVSQALIGREIPLLGLLIAIVAVYLTGLAVRSLVGKWFIAWSDRLLGRVPGFKTVYSAWKQISFTADGGEGIYAKVVLIPDETGQLRQLGFSSGKPVCEGSLHAAVFVPNAPNPIVGRVMFVELTKLTVLDMSVEDAFKLLISSGNYCPPLKPL